MKCHHKVCEMEIEGHDLNHLQVGVKEGGFVCQGTLTESPCESVLSEE